MLSQLHSDIAEVQPFLLIHHHKHPAFAVNLHLINSQRTQAFTYALLSDKAFYSRCTAINDKDI
jgi:hypothetical protein